MKPLIEQGTLIPILLSLHIAVLIPVRLVLLMPKRSTIMLTMECLMIGRQWQTPYRKPMTWLTINLILSSLWPFLWLLLLQLQANPSQSRSQFGVLLELGNQMMHLGHVAFRVFPSSGASLLKQIGSAVWSASRRAYFLCLPRALSVMRIWTQQTPASSPVPVALDSVSSATRGFLRTMRVALVAGDHIILCPMGQRPSILSGHHLHLPGYPVLLAWYQDLVAGSISFLVKVRFSSNYYDMQCSYR